MKKATFILFLSLWGLTGLRAQADTTLGENQAVLVGIHIPLGEFAKTHLAGLSASYTWSRHRLGKLPVMPEKLFGFIANGGIDYYFGKKETVAGYEYRYGGYTYLHAFGGVIYNPTRTININLTTGPTMGIYKGVGDIGFGVSVAASYYINEKVGISPALQYMKHDQTKALWVLMLRGAYSF
jgi:hypothetical protein